MKQAAMVKVETDDEKVTLTLWIYDERGKFVCNALTWVQRSDLLQWAHAIHLHQEAAAQEQLPF